MKNKCPCCGIGYLSLALIINKVEYRGHRTNLPLHYKICDFCKSEIGEVDDLKLNKQYMTTFKKEVDLLENNK